MRVHFHKRRICGHYLVVSLQTLMDRRWHTACIYLTRPDGAPVGSVATGMSLCAIYSDFYVSACWVRFRWLDAARALAMLGVVALLEPAAAVVMAALAASRGTAEPAVRPSSGRT